MFALVPPVQREAFQSTERVFTDREIEWLLAYVAKHPLETRDHQFRRCRFHLFAITDDTRWLYEKMARYLFQVNREHFDYELSSLTQIQYTEYSPEYNGQFRDHLDWAPNTVQPRKLSMTIQLSDGDTYEGGDVQLKLTSDVPHIASRKKSDAIIFPSFVLHGVTPVTRGTRRALVVWADGPPFR